MEKSLRRCKYTESRCKGCSLLSRRPPFGGIILWYTDCVRSINICREAITGIVVEEFGDGIMSAIDFTPHIQWQTGEGGRAGVIITMNRKFLPYADN